MKKESTKLFKTHCPCCNSVLWIDSRAKEIIKTEKAQKKKGSLDEMLLIEKKKKEDVDRKFKSTAELEKEKRKAAEDMFSKAFEKLDKNG